MITRLNLISLVLLLGGVPGVMTGLMIASWLVRATELVGLLIFTGTIVMWWLLVLVYLFKITKTVT